MPAEAVLGGRPVPATAPWRATLRRLLRQPFGEFRQLVDLVAVDRFEQRVAGREVAIQGPDPDARLVGSKHINLVTRNYAAVRVQVSQAATITRIPRDSTAWIGTAM